MNKVEAKEILDQELSRLQEESFEDLQKFIKSPEVVERYGRSGISYQIEIQVFWDNPHDDGGDLRIIASIDDGSFFQQSCHSRMTSLWTLTVISREIDFYTESSSNIRRLTPTAPDRR